VLLRRIVSGVALDPQARASTVTHNRQGRQRRANGGSIADRQQRRTGDAGGVDACGISGKTDRKLCQADAVDLAICVDARRVETAREFGISAYSTQLLPPWMKRLSDYAQGAVLMADEPGERMPPMSIVDYAAIDSGLPVPPYVLSVYALICCRTGTVRTWTPIARSAAAGRKPSFAISPRFILISPTPWWRRRSIPRCRSGNISMRPQGPSTDSRRRRLPRSGAPGPFAAHGGAGLYLASAYAGFGGYTGVVQSGADCADMILREN